MPGLFLVALGVQLLAVFLSTSICHRYEEFERAGKGILWERLLLGFRAVISFSMLFYTVGVFLQVPVMNWGTLVAVSVWAAAMENAAGSFHSWLPLLAVPFGIYGLGSVVSILLIDDFRDHRAGLVISATVYLIAAGAKALQNRRDFIRAVGSKYQTQQEHERLGVFMDMLPAKVAWLDHDRRYILVNRPYAEAQGTRVEDFSGKKIGFTNKKTSIFVRRKIRRFIASGDTEGSFELDFPSTDSPKLHLFLLKKFQPSTHRAPELMVVAVDIEEKHRMNELIEEERARSAQSARMANLGEMAAGIAHEIRNPLAIMMANLQILKRDATSQPPQVQSVLERATRVESSGARIVKIIECLTNLSRDTEKEDYAWHPLSKIVEDPVLLCQERLRSHGVTLELVPIPSDLMVRCQPHEIAQIILNLLNNAFDATEGGQDRKIRLEFEQRPEGPRVVVSDNGKGVPDPKRLFVPFYTTKAPGRGTGLGLSISSKIMSKHGGRLVYERDGGWTRFGLLFPEAAIQRQGASEQAS